MRENYLEPCSNQIHVFFALITLNYVTEQCEWCHFKINFYNIPRSQGNYNPNIDTGGILHLFCGVIILPRVGSVGSDHKHWAPLETAVFHIYFVG